MRPSWQTLRIAPLVLSSLASAGCGLRGAVNMPHPLVTGKVAPNVSEDRRRAGYPELNGLNVQWVDEASIVSLDERQACFAVKLRWILDPKETEAGEPYVDLAKLIPRLKSEPELTQWTYPKVTPVTNASVAGMTRETSTEGLKICDPNGHDCRPGEVRSTRDVAGAFRVLDGGGTACVAHGGRITKETSSLILTFSNPKEPSLPAHRFAWAFARP